LEALPGMARVCCLAGIEADLVPLFSAVLRDSGESALAILANLDVPELSKLAPDILVCDVDRLEIDPLEMVRQLRFVLPACTMVVYTDAKDQAWARECHLAGATCVLSKRSDEPQLALGLRHAIQSGCWTDPRFVA
jgi:DNA-binding NarL/FixJ family response regulator